MSKLLEKETYLEKTNRELQELHALKVSLNSFHLSTVRMCTEIDFEFPIKFDT